MFTGYIYPPCAPSPRPSSRSSPPPPSPHRRQHKPSSPPRSRSSSTALGALGMAVPAGDSELPTADDVVGIAEGAGKEVAAAHGIDLLSEVSEVVGKEAAAADGVSLHFKVSDVVGKEAAAADGVGLLSEVSDVAVKQDASTDRVLLPGEVAVVLSDLPQPAAIPVLPPPIPMLPPPLQFQPAPAVVADLGNNNPWVEVVRRRRAARQPVVVDQENGIDQFDGEDGFEDVFSSEDEAFDLDTVLWVQNRKNRRAAKKWSQARKTPLIGTKNGVGMLTYGSYGEYGLEF